MIKSKKIYKNEGNFELLNRLINPSSILDVGCGAGDNAKKIKDAYPFCEIYGITYSPDEVKLAEKYLKECWRFDLDKDFENKLPSELEKKSFDVILFSHILEHLRWPEELVSLFSGCLKSGGDILIAIPNILNWRTRMKFISGKFEYDESGVMDDTHLRFFTYYTADQYLLSKLKGFKLISKTVTGSVPLWILRRYILSEKISLVIDEIGCKYFPNLFGSQVIIHVRKQ